MNTADHEFDPANNFDLYRSLVQIEVIKHLIFRFSRRNDVEKRRTTIYITIKLISSQRSLLSAHDFISF